MRAQEMGDGPFLAPRPGDDGRIHLGGKDRRASVRPLIFFAGLAKLISLCPAPG